MKRAVNAFALAEHGGVHRTPLLAFALSPLLALPLLAAEPEPPPANVVCPVVVRDVLAIDASHDRAVINDATDYGIVLRALDPVGTRRFRIALANDQRIFHVDVVASVDGAPGPDRLGHASSPIYVAFPEKTPLRDAWVESIADGDASVTCGTADVYTDRMYPRSPRFPFAGADREGRTIEEGFSRATPVAVDRASATERPQPTCAKPYVAPAWRRATHVDPTRIHGVLRGSAQFVMGIDAAGVVVAARIVVSTLDPSIDAEVLRSSREAGFTPMIFDCVAIPSEYSTMVGWN